MKKFTSLFQRRKPKTTPKEQPARYGDVYAVEAFLAPFAREEVKACHVKPGEEVIAGIACPENLNALTIGDIIELADMKGTSLDIFRACTKYVLHISSYTDEEVMELPAPRVYGFINFVREELERITALFESIKIKPTPEQVEAGIEQLNFGMFGLLDNYARRMGITSHDEAAKTPWLNVFATTKIDNATLQYRERLADVMKYKNQHPNNNR